jgi:hypothetical protein
MPIPITLAVKIVKVAFSLQDISANAPTIAYQTYLGLKSNDQLLAQASPTYRKGKNLTNMVVDTIDGLGVTSQDHFQRNVGQRG